MFGKIVIGILIGFVSGFFYKKTTSEPTRLLCVSVIALVSIGFIVSSFNYGATYGLMAIGEIVAGFYMASIAFKEKQ